MVYSHRIPLNLSCCPAIITFLLFTIRPYLDLHIAKTIAISIVYSKLDYCNSLYYGLPKYQINRLQHIQNALSRTIVQPFSTPILNCFLSYYDNLGDPVQLLVPANFYLVRVLVIVIAYSCMLCSYIPVYYRCLSLLFFVM